MKYLYYKDLQRLVLAMVRMKIGNSKSSIQVWICYIVLKHMFIIGCHMIFNSFVHVLCICVLCVTWLWPARLSDCLSHSRPNNHRIMFSLLASAWNLIFWYQISYHRSHHLQGLRTRVGWVHKECWFSTDKSLYLRNDKTQAYNYNGRLIRNRIQVSVDNLK